MALRPERVFWGLVGLRFVAWWLLPTLVARTAPLDVIEGLVWGREWQWGYWKHPPLAAWLLEATVSLFGARLPALFLLGPACVAVTLGLVWRLARRVLDASWALVAVLALDGIYYYGYASPKLNPDLLQLPLWAGAVLLLHTALASRRLAAWVGFGLLVGLGVLAKYYTIALVVGLLPVLLVTARGRRSWRTPGPWLAALVAFVVVAPHLVWLAETDFISLRYAQGRAQSETAALQRITEPASFLAGQAAIALPLLLLLFVAGWRPRQLRKSRLATLDGALLLAAALGPLLVTMAAGAIFGLRLSGGSRESWGTPLLSFVGVLLLLLAELPKPKMRRFLTAWALLFGLQVLAYPLAIRVGPVLGRRVDRVRIPGRALAEHVESIWRSRGAPPGLLAGDAWIAGNAAFFMAARPPVYIQLRPERSPWIDEAELLRRGAIVLWDPQEDEASYRQMLTERFPTAEILAPFRLPIEELSETAPVFIGVAVIPASSASSESS